MEANGHDACRLRATDPRSTGFRGKEARRPDPEASGTYVTRSRRPSRHPPHYLP